MPSKCKVNCHYWNDRRSRRVFLCLYSAIFHLTSAKFQTFAYNSRTIWSSCMKFWQQFEINEFYICIKFRGNRSRDLGFRTRKPPHKFGVKSGLRQKRLKYGKKYFLWLYVLRYTFIPTNPLLAAMRFCFFFFSFFFFLIFVHSSSPKPQNIEIYFLCRVAEVQTQLFLPKFFGATPPGIPQNGATKNQFFEGLKLESLFFFDISRYLTDKYFDIVWGCHPPGDPPNGPLKNQFFLWLNLGCHCFTISEDI